VKGEDGHVQQRQLLLDAQEMREPALQRIGWNDERDGRERIGRFKGSNFFDERGFKIGVVVSGDDSEQKKPLGYS
jgi:hypothetical protein